MCNAHLRHEVRTVIDHYTDTRGGQIGNVLCWLDQSSRTLYALHDDAMKVPG